MSEWTSTSESNFSEHLKRGEVDRNGVEQDPCPPDPHVQKTTDYRSLTEVSSWLSDARTAPYDPATDTGCWEVHHPSLAEWCPDCMKTRKPLQQQPSAEEDRL